MLAPATGTYLELKADNSNVNTGIIPDNNLGIKYYSFDKAHDAVIRILNERGELLKEINKTIEYGNNFLQFKLDNHFNKETTYFIEISDLRQTRYRTSFRIAK